MSNVAANPAVLPPLYPCMVTQAIQSFSKSNGNVRVHSPYGVLDGSKVAGIAANFPRQNANENCGLGCACRIASRRLFGHCFGGLPAPGGDSLFCFGFAALRVTVSLQILFGEYSEKICPDPP